MIGMIISISRMSGMKKVDSPMLQQLLTCITMFQPPFCFLVMEVLSGIPSRTMEDRQSSGFQVGANNNNSVMMVSCSLFAIKTSPFQLRYIP